MPFIRFFQIPATLLLLAGCWGSAQALEVTLVQRRDDVETHDFVELTLRTKDLKVSNPFTEVLVKGSCQREMLPGVAVNGFCDSADGSSYKIRFLPQEPGSYSFSITFQAGSEARNFTGTFQAKESRRKGLLRVHKDYPNHFAWQGTGEACFINGTTAYWLLGWQEDAVICRALDRLAKKKVNRIRVALCGRTHGGKRWDEPLVEHGDAFRMRLTPWVAKDPLHPTEPGIDPSRFDIAFWHKCERLLAAAREKDMLVSLIFYLDGKDPGVDPFGKEHAGGEAEQLYYKYAAARFAAYTNVMWDIANEYRLFRTDEWAREMGEFLRECDPYDHLTSIHGHGDFRFGGEAWADFCAYQSWDEHGGYPFMLNNRLAQNASGKPKPQINEEYGYEDHYPKGWGDGRKAPARNADSRRRLAWEMSMAGTYQTTGERADRGTGQAADTGGGWINGRGDAEMIMLDGYAHMVDFFTSIPWWRLEPKKDGILSGKGMLLAEPGKHYVAYLPKGGSVSFDLAAGNYGVVAVNARTGERKPMGEATEAGVWQSPNLPDDGDWALLLTSVE